MEFTPCGGLQLIQFVDLIQHCQAIVNSDTKPALGHGADSTRFISTLAPIPISMGTLVNRDIESSFSRDADLRTTDRSGQVSRRYRGAIDGSEEFINRANRRSRETDRDLSREIKRDRDNRR